MTACSPPVHTIDPLTDSRWPAFLDRHPRASVFHTAEWLDSLKRTYGYEPFVLTTTASGPLENGLVFCRVRTWAARRLVSLPFSDHCEPLVDRPDDLAAMVDHLVDEVRQHSWRSVELRPRLAAITGLAEGAIYQLHTLDIVRPADEIFAGFHHSSTQRAIRRAEREGLEYETGTSEPLVSAFYALLRLTRRRHGLPPQPFAWFWNLAACLGDRLTVHLASKDGKPVAGILTLTFGKTLFYKYGGSDAKLHRLGGMPFLFWRAIQWAQEQGIEQLDLGRSDLDQPGLIAFKDHLGAARSTLTYFTWPPRKPRAAGGGLLSRVARRLVPLMPDTALDAVGRLLYRHVG